MVILASEKVIYRNIALHYQASYTGMYMTQNLAHFPTDSFSYWYFSVLDLRTEIYLVQGECPTKKPNGFTMNLCWTKAVKPKESKKLTRVLSFPLLLTSWKFNSRHSETVASSSICVIHLCIRQCRQWQLKINSGHSLLHLPLHLPSFCSMKQIQACCFLLAGILITWPSPYSLKFPELQPHLVGFNSPTFSMVITLC